MLSNSAQALLEPQHSAHQAIRQVQATVQEGRTIAVDIDLAKFFDTVNHDVLMTPLAKTIGDKALLTLIGRYLRAGVLVGEHVEPSEVGTPQGGPLSPLLANILLDQLDRELQRRGHPSSTVQRDPAEFSSIKTTLKASNSRIFVMARL